MKRQDIIYSFSSPKPVEIKERFHQIDYESKGLDMKQGSECHVYHLGVGCFSNAAILNFVIVARSVHYARSAPSPNADDFFRTLLHVKPLRHLFSSSNAEQSVFFSIDSQPQSVN
jgi:hypothetical protein